VFTRHIAIAKEFKTFSIVTIQERLKEKGHAVSAEVRRNITDLERTSRIRIIGVIDHFLNIGIVNPGPTSVLVRDNARIQAREIMLAE